MDNKKIVLGSLMLVATSLVIGGVVCIAKKVIKKQSDLIQRYKTYYDVSREWLINKNEDINVVEYFKDNDYKTIAIYGMGNMGELFYEELKKSGVDIKVAYFIDKDAEELYYGIDDISVVGIANIAAQEDVDVIIVTPVYDFDPIREKLLSLDLKADVISLADVIYEI